jgi:hypothetical protein
MTMDSDPEVKKIEIGQETLKNLNTLRKWTWFLSVSGFIFLGLIITLGLIAGTFLTAFNASDKTSGVPDIVILAAFTVFALINLFPILFLFRFSKHMSHAISTLEKKEFHVAVKYLKRFFIYIGILLILIILSYIAGLILSRMAPAFFHRLNIL